MIIDDLLDGAVDLHCHSGPSPMPRRITHAEAARQAADAGFRAIVAKCHYHDTVTDILAMEPLLADLQIQVLGGIALNSVAGGLNPWAVDRSLRMGGKVVWFPTISSRKHLDHAAAHAETQSHFQPLGMMQSAEVPVLDDSGSALPAVRQIIEQAKEAGALVSTGHLDAPAALEVVRTAHDVGHTQVVVSHPNFVTGIERDQLAEMLDLGAVVEHEVAMYFDDHVFEAEVLVDWIRTFGAEHTVLGSDLGQVGLPLPVDAYRGLIARLLELGITEEEIALMIRDNPVRLIGLDA